MICKLVLVFHIIILSIRVCNIPDFVYWRHYLGSPVRSHQLILLHLLEVDVDDVHVVLLLNHRLVLIDDVAVVCSSAVAVYECLCHPSPLQCCFANPGIVASNVVISDLISRSPCDGIVVLVSSSCPLVVFFLAYGV